MAGDIAKSATRVRPDAARVLGYFKDHPYSTVAAAAQLLGISVRAVRGIVARLMADGEIRESRAGRDGQPIARFEPMPRERVFGPGAHFGPRVDRDYPYRPTGTPLARAGVVQILRIDVPRCNSIDEPVDGHDAPLRARGEQGSS